MGNGRPGEDPIADIVVHGREVFGPEIDARIRRIVAAGPARPVLDLLETLIWAWPNDSRATLNPVGLATVLDRLATLTLPEARG